MEIAAPPRRGAAREEIDLDEPTYFSINDLSAYTLASLQLRGAKRPGKPTTTTRWQCR